MDTPIYRPPPLSQKSSELIHQAKKILQKNRRQYPGQARDSIEYAILGFLKSELEGLDQHNPSIEPLLSEIEARHKFLGNRIYFMSEA